jgi:hypothetical protein
MDRGIIKFWYFNTLAHLFYLFHRNPENLEVDIN